MYVAETKNGKIVGFSSAIIDETNEGTVYTLYILSPYQRMGIGKELIKSIIMRLKENDVISLKLWCFEDNPSRKFYDKLGGKILEQRISDVGGKQLNELLYGWENINIIFDNLK